MRNTDIYDAIMYQCDKKGIAYHSIANSDVSTSALQHIKAKRSTGSLQTLQGVADSIGINLEDIFMEYEMRPRNGMKYMLIEVPENINEHELLSRINSFYSAQKEHNNALQ